jgi:hypothetical protein
MLVEERERRLEPMRQVAGLGQRARDTLLAIAQQLVQLADERLHFRRIVAIEPILAPLANAVQPRP